MGSEEAWRASMKRGGIVGYRRQWEQGYAARKAGKPIEANPHVYVKRKFGGTFRAGSWDAGWQAADAELRNASGADG